MSIISAYFLLFSVPAVQRTCSVRVDDVPADAVTNKQLLELYFETWGGAVEKIITNPEQKTVIIIFQSQDGMITMAKQDVSVRGILRTRCSWEYGINRR